MVIIGILIALQFNNWNEERIEKNQQIKIMNRVLSDVQNDIQELSNTIDFLDRINSVFEKVRNDSISLDLLGPGISRYLTYNYAPTLNKTGVKQLKKTTNKDSLSIQIIELYDNMENNLIYIENNINDEVD